MHLKHFSIILIICRLKASLVSCSQPFTAGIITLVVNSGQWASLVELHSCRGGNGEPRGNCEASSRQAYGDVAGCEELVRLQLSDGRSLGGISMQHPLDERGRGWVDVLQRERVVNSDY